MINKYPVTYEGNEYEVQIKYASIFLGGLTVVIFTPYYSKIFRIRKLREVYTYIVLGYEPFYYEAREDYVRLIKEAFNRYGAYTANKKENLDRSFENVKNLVLWDGKIG